MELDESKLRSGAMKMLKDCLQLRGGEDLVIFCDQTTIEIVPYLVRAARDLEVNCATLFEPIELQSLHDPDISFALLVHELLDNTAAVLSCLSDSAESMPFRRRVISNCLKANVRVGHMPGASLLSLAAADADYEQMRRDCYNLAIALSKGRSMRITTADKSGQKHELWVQLGGLDQPGWPSNGIIQRGAWGNIPGGEAFIAPILNSAQGEIVINVALPNVVLAAPDWQNGAVGEEAVLHFVDGCLADVKTTSSYAWAFFERTKHYAEAQGDSNWRQLAEIGIGTNASLNFPTGRSLFDEKIYGTVHIAIGDNVYHGGTNTSVIHEDMVTVGDVEVDAKPVLCARKICVNLADWLENYRQVTLERFLASQTYVRYSGKEFVTNEEALNLVLRGSGGRSMNLAVGNIQTAKLAAQVIKHLPRERSYVQVQSIVSRVGLAQHTVLQILQLLYDYGLLEVGS